ncbi:MAG: FAD-binding protein [Desulfotignum sp.]|nr:FAD-binding protein [Desulfotignum sp.]MCF8112603.1 FAD-binding protein [Desulfotignum sp.]MCF8124943.1 FAD-binding protein [Desulfotignum sp.]
MRVIETDVLVIGTGGAGLYAAIRAGERGRQVTIWDKGLIGRSGGTVSGAGVSAVGPWSDPGDSYDLHFRDTVIGGAYLSDQPLVRILTSEAHERVMEMEKWGLQFDKRADGRYQLDRAGGHTCPRVMAISDRVGLQMTKVLRAQCIRFGVRHQPDVMTTRLLTKQGVVTGAMGVDLGNGEIIQADARAVILATGGVGQLYPVTSNPVKVTGDGFELALTAGASLINMEQVQFYPCGLVYPRSLHGFILGIMEYARLYNADNERFMARYEPELLEHTTRDRLARSIYTEIVEGRGTPNKGVFLDATGLSEDTFRSFQYELGVCAERGFDYRHKRVEVAPAAHFFMGGIAIDGNARTTVPGLFAAGEVSGGVQGGNRLSGNSLAEILVFGHRAGDSAAEFAGNQDRIEPDKTQVREEKSRLTRLLNKGPLQLTAAQVKHRLRAVMQAHVFVSRTVKGLETARQALDEISRELADDVGITGSRFHHNYSLLDYLELEKMVTTGQMIVAAALARKESRGAHYLEDFPGLDTATPPQCTEITINRDTHQMNIKMRPVEMSSIHPQKPAQ